MEGIIINLIYIAVVVVISLVVYKIIIKSVEKTLKSFGRELKAPKTFSFFIGLIIFIIASLSIMKILNFDILPYLTGLGISGVIVALALQEPLANFISGLFVLTTRKLIEGDVVNINDFSGVVEAVKINHTVLKTFDGKEILIPNKQVWLSSIVRYWPTNIRRMEIEVGVSYNSDLKKVIELLQKALEEEPLVVKEGVSNAIAFKEFGTSSINFIIRFWIKRDDYYEAPRSLAFRIKELFEKEGVEIPFTQIDLHIKKD